MRLLLVCGPGGSGTTAVAGSIAHLGAIGFGPFLGSNDERTKNTYELIPFRELLRRWIIPGTFSVKSGTNIKCELQLFRQRVINKDFGPYDASANIPIFLKEPLAALFISQICDVFDTRLIYVLRPLADIHATTTRRQWGFTMDATRVLYSHMFNALINYQTPTLIVRYPELIASPVEYIMKIAAFAGLNGTPKSIFAASSFVTTHCATYRHQRAITVVA